MVASVLEPPHPDAAEHDFNVLVSPWPVDNVRPFLKFEVGAGLGSHWPQIPAANEYAIPRFLGQRCRIAVLGAGAEVLYMQRIDGEGQNEGKRALEFDQRCPSEFDCSGFFIVAKHSADALAISSWRTE